jgi:hypothetical protein
MNPPRYAIPADLIGPFLPVIAALDAVGVPYHIGGSIASSTWGFPRATQDADIIADLALPQVAPFVARLQPEFYLDVPAIETAIRQRGMFNLIHQLFTRRGPLALAMGRSRALLSGCKNSQYMVF